MSSSKAKEYKTRGNKAFKGGDWDEAIRCYGRAIKMDEKDFLTLANRSAALLKVGKADEALKDAELCVKIKPKYAKGHVRKAAALHARKEFGEEIKAIQYGLKCCPEEPHLVQAMRTAKKSRTSSSKACQSAKRTEASIKAAKSRNKKAKDSANVSQFVKETKKNLQLQMAAIQAQLDMIDELAAMQAEEKLDLLFTLMDKDQGGTIDAKEMADALRKQNDGLSFAGSIEKSIEMIAIFDDDGDAELDRDEFEHFVEKMVMELNSTFDEFAEFLVFQMLFTEDKEVQEDDVDLDHINELVRERGELLDSLSDPRMKILFELFDRDGSGSVGFTEVACGLYHLTQNMEESAKATTGLLLMLDKDDRRVLGYQQFAKLILAIAATTGTTFDDVADELTSALTSPDAELDDEVLEKLTISVEQYEQARDKERVFNAQRKELTKLDPLAYNRLLRLFDLWDANGDGTLDFDELYEGLCKYHAAANDNKTKEEVEEAAKTIIEEDDINGDQVLDREEFACAMVAYSNKMGTDMHELIDFMCVVTSLGEEQLPYFGKDSRPARAEYDEDVDEDEDN